MATISPIWPKWPEVSRQNMRILESHCTQNRAIANAYHCYYCSYHLTKPLVTHCYNYKYFLIIIGSFNSNGKTWRASEEKFGKSNGTDEF